MPTAARMAGAVVFGILAWFISEMVKPLMPDGTDFGRFSEYNIMIGILSGWIVMGTRSNEGSRAAVGGGLTTAIAMMFWGLLIYSVVEMIKLSFRKHYPGPVEAVVGVFELGFEYGTMIATPSIIGTLLVCGAIGGAFCSWVAQRWS